MKNLTEALIENPAVFKGTKNTTLGCWKTTLYRLDACLKPSTSEYDKNILDKKLEIVLERHTRDLMIRLPWSSASSSFYFTSSQ